MTPNPRRVLALAPHTDDVEFGVAGVLVELLKRGAEVKTIAFSIARESVPSGWPEDILATEVRQAAHVLGLKDENVHVLDYPVRRFSEHRQDILEYLFKFKKSFDPDMVFLPAGGDVHQDHHTIFEEGVRAFKTTTVLGYELPWNTLSFRSTAVFSISEEALATKCQALTAYKSQAHRPFVGEEIVRSMARMRGATIGTKYAEAFEVVRWVPRWH